MILERITGISLRASDFLLEDISEALQVFPSRKNDNGALVNVQKTLETEKIPEDRQITVHKWQMIVNTLYKQMYLHEWRKRFVDPRVLDGTHWSLDVLLSGNRKRSYSGINDYPAYWSELLKVFRKFAKM